MTICTAAHPLVPQHLVVGTRGQATVDAPPYRVSQHAIELDEPQYREALAPLRRPPELLFTENETNTPASLRDGNRDALRARTASTITS